jgi:hypothetical protein
MVTKKYGSKKDEINEQCRILHNKDCHDLNKLPSTVRIMKSRKEMGMLLIWGTREMQYRILVEKTFLKHPLGSVRI